MTKLFNLEYLMQLDFPFAMKIYYFLPLSYSFRVFDLSLVQKFKLLRSVIVKSKLSSFFYQPTKQLNYIYEHPKPPVLY